MKTRSESFEKSRIDYAIRNCEARKIELYKPQEVVHRAISEHGDRLAVSCSFGSCSVVVLHMALQVKPDIKVIFNNTGVEYPETYHYRDILRSRWDLNLIETKPEKTFWKCVEEYGFPLIRSEYGGLAKKRRRTGKPECCIFLKERPMALACKQHDIAASLTGLRCAESGVRMFVIAQRGQFYETKKWGHLWRYHPIALWTTRMVQEYLAEHEIPRNPIYDKGIPRSGCMPCTGFLHWEEQLALANPKMYRWVQKLRKTPLLDDFIQLEDDTASKCDMRAIVDDWEGTLDHWL